MTLETWLRDNTVRLEEAGVPSARLDCLIMLEDVLSKDRSWVLAHLDASMNQRTVKILGTMLEQRAKHTPMAYIRHKTEFYSRTFYIDETVLEPRPESETIIELLKSLTLPAKPVITDVGTGSGALAITAKLELPAAAVHAIDIDHACLTITSYNAKKLGADIATHYGDLLEHFEYPSDVVLANLPYVPDDFTLNQAAMNEPKLAIFGGPDGLDLFRRMFAQITEQATKPTYVITESLPPHHQQLAAIAKDAGYTQCLEQDFVQVFELIG